jgi:5-methylcytosine-specific restriction endonuclease McrA
MKRVYDIVFPDNTKRCGRCGKIKSVFEFNKNSTRNCGLSWACRECNSKHQKIYRQSDSYKQKTKITKKRYRDLNYEAGWADGTISHHRANGYIVNLHRQELINLAKSTRTCSICGIELDWSINKKKMKTYSPTLDRINNEKELNMSNVHIVCNRCNKAKGTMKYDEFIDYCRKIGSLKRSDEL